MSEWYPCPICKVTHENNTACPTTGAAGIRQPDDELEDLIGKYDEDSEESCDKCGKTFFVRAGEYRQKRCDECSRNAAIGDDGP